MPNLRARMVVGASLTIGAAGVLMAVAGPLDPPAGPVSSSHKTLSEVEPRTPINAANTPGDADSVFKITQPGSYYLPASVVGAAGKHGIEIAADGVSIDLCGFTVGGVANSLDGITTVGLSRVRIQVRNGSVGGFIGRGINLLGPGAIVSDVTVRVCGGAGMTVGDGATISDCTSSGNLGEGFITGQGCTISGCAARNNARYGIDVALGCTIQRSTASQNQFDGIHTEEDATIDGCTADANGFSGITAGLASVVRACAVSQNAGNGLAMMDGGVASGCTARDNGACGFGIGNGGTSTECTAISNTLQGFLPLGGGPVRLIGCTAALNLDVGFLVHAGVVENCVASDNLEGGIVVTGSAAVLDNECVDNGFSRLSAGIRLTATARGAQVRGNNCYHNGIGIDVDGSTNRIDGNTCVASNGAGFDIDGADNLIIRNTGSGNTPNYAIVAGNSVAPRVSVTDSDGWAGITNANHPWANLGH